MIEINAGTARLVLAPELGGAVASYEVAGIAVFHPVTDPALGAQRGHALAAYPLVPFSNRVAWGRFTFQGASFQLARNFGDHPHTIHGNAWMHPWSVIAHEPDSTTFEFRHTPPLGQAPPFGEAQPFGKTQPQGAAPSDDPAEWPFAYRTTIAYTLAQSGTRTDLTVVLTIENIDARDQPVGMGFHPYMPRRPGVGLGFASRSVWHTGADALPDARLPAEGTWSFDPTRDIDGPPIDNCFNDWPGTATLVWPDIGRTLTIEATPAADLAPSPLIHLVVFTPDAKPYVAVEPASNMTDAINHPDEPGQGLVVLRPGQTLQGTFTYRLDSSDRDTVLAPN